MIKSEESNKLGLLIYTEYSVATIDRVSFLNIQSSNAMCSGRFSLFLSFQVFVIQSEQYKFQICLHVCNYNFYKHPESIHKQTTTSVT